MLVLSRFIGERIMLQLGDHTIILTVIEIKKRSHHKIGCVRLGFDGTIECRIDREEIFKLRSREEEVTHAAR